MWRETRPGLIVHEAVCDEHRGQAVNRWKYRSDKPPIPAPDVG